jgi:hypothetical protein
MLRNKHGLAFTAASQDAVDAYDNLSSSTAARPATS